MLKCAVFLIMNDRLFLKAIGKLSRIFTKKSLFSVDSSALSAENLKMIIIQTIERTAKIICLGFIPFIEILLSKKITNILYAGFYKK